MKRICSSAWVALLTLLVSLSMLALPACSSDGSLPADPSTLCDPPCESGVECLKGCCDCATHVTDCCLEDADCEISGAICDTRKHKCITFDGDVDGELPPAFSQMSSSGSGGCASTPSASVIFVLCAIGLLYVHQQRKKFFE